MPFSIRQVLLLTTATAGCCSLIRTYPILALAIPTLTVSSMCTWNIVNRQGVDAFNAICAGALSGFATMLSLGGANLAFSYARMYATDSWPDPETVYVSTDTAIVLFVLFYGGAAAIAGGVVGLCVFTVHFVVTKVLAIRSTNR